MRATACDKHDPIRAQPYDVASPQIRVCVLIPIRCNSVIFKVQASHGELHRFGFLQWAACSGGRPALLAHLELATLKIGGYFFPAEALEH